jgi:hypothetical protein
MEQELMVNPYSGRIEMTLTVHVKAARQSEYTSEMGWQDSSLNQHQNHFVVVSFIALTPAE